MSTLGVGNRPPSKTKIVNLGGYSWGWKRGGGGKGVEPQADHPRLVGAVVD